MRKRILYLDIVKTIAILCVVYMHIDLLGQDWMSHFTDICAYIGVPLFFLVNGALLFNSKSYSLESHIKKIIHIICVYTCWKLLMVMICEVVDGGPIFPWNKLEFVNYLLGYNSNYYPTGAFWFFAALIQCYVFFPILQIIFNKVFIEKEMGHNIVIFICAVLCFFSYIIPTIQCFLQLAGITGIEFSDINEYNPFGIYGHCVLWFVLGGVIHRVFYIEKKKCPINTVTLGTLAIVNLILLFVVKGFTNGFTGDQYLGIPGYVLFPTLVASVSIYILLLLLFGSKEERAHSFFAYIGNNTLGIYILHLLIGRLVAERYWELIPVRGVIPNTLKTIALVVASTIIWSFLAKIPIVKSITKL